MGLWLPKHNSSCAGSCRLRGIYHMLCVLLAQWYKCSDGCLQRVFMFKDFSGRHCTFNLADDGPAKSLLAVAGGGRVASPFAVLGSFGRHRCTCARSAGELAVLMQPVCSVVPCSRLMHLLGLPLVVLVMLLLYLTVTYIVVLFGQAIW